ncbi:MAG: hypothetical protein J6M90_01245 [Oscillospiraceae bacterium]|mgnify:CR=1 FL=1|nr:hypothetical protein [Oscillospiraceae bacterium]MBQ9209891.1 hypothetical protein [Oscillospiraceae bacterium]MBR4345902.1 hypothetical protein [Oscillospiraceae bacterium]
MTAAGTRAGALLLSLMMILPLSGCDRKKYSGEATLDTSKLVVANENAKQVYNALVGYNAELAIDDKRIPDGRYKGDLTKSSASHDRSATAADVENYLCQMIGGYETAGCYVVNVSGGEITAYWAESDVFGNIDLIPKGAKMTVTEDAVVGRYPDETTF